MEADPIRLPRRCDAAEKAGKNCRVGLFADGTAVAQIGGRNVSHFEKTIDGVITVSTDETCAAIKDIFEDTRAIAEPSGALALPAKIRR